MAWEQGCSLEHLTDTASSAAVLWVVIGTVARGAVMKSLPWRTGDQGSNTAKHFGLHNSVSGTKRRRRNMFPAT